MPTEADRVFRDFERYTGDGRPNEPTGAPLPVGDPRSGIHQPKRREIRQAFTAVFEAAEDAEAWADVAMSVAGGSTIYATRAALAAAVPVVPYPEGTICYVQGRRYRVDPIGPDGLVAVDMDWSGQLEALIARMKDGQSVRGAAFGDSTTDGNGTTGWTDGTRNPVNGSGNAIGAGAHDPEFAWPRIMRNIIRQMHRNTSIAIWNAGYGGRAVITRWALDNFQAAVIDNPAYGTPDFCLLNWGLNDIVAPGFTLESFADEYRYLISLMDYYGIVPVLVTPDPACQTTVRQPGNFEKLVEVIRALGREYGIEVLESGAMLDRIFSVPGGAFRWASQQPDGLHGGNRWHMIKGAFLAAKLFPNTLWLSDGQDAINVAPWSKHANSDSLTATHFNLNNEFGSCLLVAGGSYATDDVLTDLFVWSEIPDRRAYWHSVDGDGYFNPRPMNQTPTIQFWSWTNNTIATTPSPTAGQATGGPEMRASEAPVEVAILSPGLSRLQFRAPRDTAANSVFMGYFSLRKARYPETASAMIPPGGADLVFWPRDRLIRSPALVGFGQGRTLQMTFEVVLPVASGVILLSHRAYGGAASEGDNNKYGVMLYRTPTDSAALHLVTYKDDGTGELIGAALASAAYTWSDCNRFRFAAALDGSGNQIVSLFRAGAAQTLVASATITRGNQTIPFGGQIGGFFKNYATPGDPHASLNVINALMV